MLAITEDKLVEQETASQASRRVSSDNSIGHTQKRKRETSPSPRKAEELLRNKNKKRGKRKARQIESPAEQHPEKDVVHVKAKSSTKSQTQPRKVSAESSSDLGSLQASSAASFAQNGSVPTVDVSDPPITDTFQLQSQHTLPEPQPIPLFHAHGRKRKNPINLSKPLVLQTQVQTHQASRKASSQKTNSPTSSSISLTVVPPEVNSTVPDIESSQVTTRSPLIDPLDCQASSVHDEMPMSLPLQDERPTLWEPIEESRFEQTMKPLSNDVAMPLSSPSRQLPVPSTSSITRSTRSQCKYHRISLPKEEDGPYVSFLVPGCSLTNHELIQEIEIKDHGEATYEDSLRVVGDIDNLYLDQQLIGALRQLVGLDMLREGEVYYLPQLGEWVPRKQVGRKSVSEKVRVPVVGGYASSYAGSPASIRSLSTKPPLSNADSTSTSLSALRKLFDSEKRSISATTDSESEFSTEHQSTSMSQVISKGRPRGNKVKDASYKPDEQDESVEGPTQKKRRKLPSRGVKRVRTMDIEAGEEGQRKSKRLKKSLTAPGPLSPVKDSSTS